MTTRRKEKKEADRLIEFFEHRQAWYSVAEAARLAGYAKSELEERIREFDTTARHGREGFSWSELAMVFLDRYSVGAIERLLGDHAAAALPPLLRGRELRVVVPEYKIVLARRIAAASEGALTIDDVVADALDIFDNVAGYEELLATLAGFAQAAHFPFEYRDPKE